MTCHHNVLGIATEVGNVAPSPSQGFDHLKCNAGNGDRRLWRAWAQRIVHHHHASTHGVQWRRDKRVIGFVEAAPIAPMNEHHDRCVSLLGWKDVERFIGAIAIRDVQGALKRGPRLG